MFNGAYNTVVVGVGGRPPGNETNMLFVHEAGHCLGGNDIMMIMIMI